MEVGIRPQKAFQILARLKTDTYAENAQRHSREALERAETTLAIESDRQRIRAAAAEVDLVAS